MLDKEVQDPLKKYAISSAQVGIFFQPAVYSHQEGWGPTFNKKKMPELLSGYKAFQIGVSMEIRLIMYLDNILISSVGIGILGSDVHRSTEAGVP